MKRSIQWALGFLRSYLPGADYLPAIGPPASQLRALGGVGAASGWQASLRATAAHRPRGGLGLLASCPQAGSGVWQRLSARRANPSEEVEPPLRGQVKVAEARGSRLVLRTRSGE